MNSISRDATKGLDLNAALAAMDGDQALFAELVELFCTKSPELLGALQDAVAKSDAKAIGAAAHSLKGSLGVFHAHRAAKAAAQLEELAEADDLKPVAEISAVLQAEVERVCAELELFNATVHRAIRIR